MKKILVIYHQDCSDGFGAAYAAWKKFGARAEYVGASPREVPQVPLRGREIFVLDNSFSARDARRVARLAKRLVIIDHHASSERDVRSVREHLFDRNHSGAVLAWHYFHYPTPLPRLLKHVEDYDLWRFRVPHTKAIRTSLELLPLEFAAWEKFARKLERPASRREIIREGELLIRYRASLVARMVRRAQVVKFCGIKTLTVNSSFFEDELGHEFSKLLPPMGIVWREKEDVMTFSLRSIGEFDVAKLAARFGGGGHRNSAGFSLPLGSALPWKRVRSWA